MLCFHRVLQRTVNGKKAQKQRCDTAIPTKRRIFSRIHKANICDDGLSNLGLSGHCCDLGRSKLSEIVNVNHYYGKAENINMLL